MQDDVGLFCCHGGMKGGIFDKMKDALKDNRFIGEADFQDPLKKDKEKNAKKAKEWAKKIAGSLM